MHLYIVLMLGGGFRKRLTGGFSQCQLRQFEKSYLNCKFIIVNDVSFKTWEGVKFFVNWRA